jgi:hypothetical protein
MASEQPNAEAGSRKTSLLNTLSNKLAVAKQWTKQKIGKAESSQEAPEFVEMLNRLRNTRDTIKAMLSVAKDAEHAYRKQVEHNAQFCDLLAKLQFDQKQEHVTAFLSTERVHKDNSESVRKSFEELVIASLHSLQKTELEQALDAKKRYESAHLDLDAFSAELEHAKSKSQEKLAAATQALHSATEKYEQCKNDLITKCEALENRKTQIFDENLSKFLQLQTAAVEDNLKACKGQYLPAEPIESHPILEDQLNTVDFQ